MNQSIKMERTAMTGSELIATTLHRYRVSHVFFVEAILRKSLVEMEALGIKRVSAHAEKAAAYMADGYARVSGRPGVAMAQSVGGANLAAGLKDPFLGCSPVIAITGRKPALSQHRNAYQEIIHQPMFEPVTKFNAVVEQLAQAPFLLRQAFRAATSGTPGPVHLDVLGALGEITDNAEAAVEVACDSAFDHYPPFRPSPQPEHVEAAARLIEQARRPVIVAGGGVTASGAGPELIALAEALAIPVATSLNGKETIPGNHHLNLGVVGSYSVWCANQIVCEADLVIFVGSHTGDQVTNGWAVPALGTPVIQIDIEPVELGRNYNNAAYLCGDAKVSLARLSQALEGAAKKEAWAEHARQRVRTWTEEVELRRTSDQTPIQVERLCQELTRFLPQDAVLVADTGWSGIWTGAMVQLNRPGQKYLRAAGSLGWAFPAALGAKCGAPERTVVCFCGDGAFYYHMGELETALRCGINTITVINNNSGFGQCRAGVNNSYGDRPGNRDEIYRFGPVEFARVAQDMGCFGIKVEHPKDIGPALYQALEAGRPAVVEVITDSACQAPSPWSPPLAGS